VRALEETRAPEAGSLRPEIVWKKIPFGAKRRRQTAAYSKRHYGERSWELTDPHVVVEHYTTGDEFQSTWNYFAANVRHLGEMPGVCSHFVIDSDGKIYQLVNLAVRCRHAIGLNWTAVGIEMVGTSDARSTASHSSERRSSSRLAHGSLRDRASQRDRSRREPHELVPPRAPRGLALHDAFGLAPRRYEGLPAQAEAPGDPRRRADRPASRAGRPELLSLVV
jgi:hypothetical protein